MSMDNQVKEQIAALTEHIAQAKEKVEPCYAQIGKLYVALHASDYESEFKPLFEQIVEAEQTIRESNARIRELMGMVCCEKCGNDVPKGTAFCSKCGAPMPDSEQAEDLSDKIRCHVCGKFVDKNEVFCSFCFMPLKHISEKTETVCETPVEEEQAVPAVAFAEEETVMTEELPVEDETVVFEDTPVFEEDVPEEAVVEEPASEEPAMPTVSGRVCPHCAHIVKEDFAFCTSCGHRMDEAPAPTPVNRVCAVCGREASANARFCVGCGNPMG